MDQSGTAQPLVSVVIPAFNAESTLEQTLLSAAAQTYPRLEIIVVDDGSTDKTANIARVFCAKDSRARLIFKANGGVASARNLGIERAAGEWIAPLDADDLWHPTKIAKQVAAALAAPTRPGFVYCWHQYIDEKGGITGSSPRIIANGRALHQLAYCNFVGNGSAPLISREALLSVGGYDSSLRERGGEGCEDQKMQLRIAQSFSVAAVPEDLVGYRNHEGSMSRRGRQMFRSWQLMLDDLEPELIIPRQIRDWILSGCYVWFGDSMIAERSFGTALRAFATALRLDPSRSSMMIGQRLINILVRVVGGRQTPGPHQQYGTSVSGATVPFDTFNSNLFAMIVRYIDEKRLSRLAVSERTADAT